jgi:hypothetical protein
LKDFDPCTILLNNDLSRGVPRVLQHLHEQYLLPPLHAGWTVRRKSRHFQSYEEVAKKFAKLLGMDPSETTTLRQYLTEYYGRILKKLKEVGAESKQTNFYI